MMDIEGLVEVSFRFVALVVGTKKFYAKPKNE